MGMVIGEGVGVFVFEMVEVVNVWNVMILGEVIVYVLICVSFFWVDIVMGESKCCLSLMVNFY